MEDLIGIYTKIKLNINNQIIITYYTYDGILHTEEFQLLDIKRFYNIYVKKKNTFSLIPFYSSQQIIKSITFKEKNKPIYFNPYVDEHTFKKYPEFKQHMDYIFNSIEKTLKDKEKILIKYMERIENVSYDELFFTEKQKEEFTIFFKMLVKELSQYAKEKGFNTNLKLISTGATSMVYEIGDKIIKIGKPRRVPYIPYCEFLLQPIVNRIFEFDGYPIHIEITQKVSTLDNEDGFAIYSNDERFLEIVSILKRRLYKIGLKCCDLHPGNVGILLNDNKIHYDPISFYTATDEVTSIQNNNHHKILQKGNYVVIDLDSIEIEDQNKYTQYLKKIKTK